VIKSKFKRTREKREGKGMSTKKKRLAEQANAEGEVGKEEGKTE